MTTFDAVNLCDGGTVLWQCCKTVNSVCRDSNHSSWLKDFHGLIHNIFIGFYRNERKKIVNFLDFEKKLTFTIKYYKILAETESIQDTGNCELNLSM